MIFTQLSLYVLTCTLLKQQHIWCQNAHDFIAENPVHLWSACMSSVSVDDIVYLGYGNAVRFGDSVTTNS